MKPRFSALTTGDAALIARPESPPFESTSSWTSAVQSATTFGRLPGISMMSFSVGMGGNLHHTAPAWYACRDGTVAPVPSRGAGGPDRPELPQLPGSFPAVRGAARDQRLAAPVRHARGAAPVAVHGQLH